MKFAQDYIAQMRNDGSSRESTAVDLAFLGQIATDLAFAYLNA